MIHHIAIWTKDSERMKSFYMQYFGMQCGEKYENKTKQFTSYFLSFNGRETRMELMHRSIFQI